MTAILIFAGTVLFFLNEAGNPSRWAKCPGGQDRQLVFPIRHAAHLRIRLREPGAFDQRLIAFVHAADVHRRQPRVHRRRNQNHHGLCHGASGHQRRQRPERPGIRGQKAPGWNGPARRRDHIHRSGIAHSDGHRNLLCGDGAKHHHDGNRIRKRFRLSERWETAWGSPLRSPRSAS